MVENSRCVGKGRTPRRAIAPPAGLYIRQQFGSKVKAVYLRTDKDTAFEPIAQVLGPGRRAETS
jgi:hypothetical protein